jgi:hypothetical protein
LAFFAIFILSWDVLSSSFVSLSLPFSSCAHLITAVGHIRWRGACVRYHIIWVWDLRSHWTSGILVLEQKEQIRSLHKYFFDNSILQHSLSVVFSFTHTHSLSLTHLHTNTLAY